MTRYRKETGKPYRQPFLLTAKPHKGRDGAFALMLCEAEMGLRKRGDRGFEVSELRQRLREARNA